MDPIMMVAPMKNVQYLPLGSAKGFILPLLLTLALDLWYPRVLPVKWMVGPDWQNLRAWALLQWSVGLCSKNQHDPFDRSGQGLCERENFKLVFYKIKLWHYEQ